MGQPISPQEWQEAVAAAQGLVDYWDELAKLAPSLGLGTRIDDDGWTLVDFTGDNLRPASSSYLYIGTDADDALLVSSFSEEDAKAAGAESPSGEPYVVTVTNHKTGQKQYLTQAQSEHMVFDVRGRQDDASVDVSVPYGITVLGVEGDDRLKGGGGGDHLLAEAGNDELIGDPGGDQLEGGDGNDWVKGGAGDHTVSGGNGDDVLSGGEASDHDSFQDRYCLPPTLPPLLAFIPSWCWMVVTAEGRPGSRGWGWVLAAIRHLKPWLTPWLMS